MELLIIPDWAPNIHPLLVHFPIALLVVAVLANLATLFIPDKFWDEAKNTILYIAGALFSGITYYSGTIAADTIFLPAEAQSVLSEHADWAEYLLWFFMLYAVLRIAFHWFDLFEKESFKIIAFIAVLPGLFIVYETSEYGGKLVYGYGAGTGQLLQQKEPESPVNADSVSTVESSFIIKENGDWRWDISSNADSDLIANFYWPKGSVQELNPATTSAEPPGLRLKASETPNMFVTHKSYKNIQIDYYLSLDDLNGNAELIHHFEDVNNYDFVELTSDGVIRQGRARDGDTVIFDEGTFKAEGALFLRVVADETHFRGYVNREMKVHGHGDAPESGSAGMRIEGTGSLLISQIELTQLY